MERRCPCRLLLAVAAPAVVLVLVLVAAAAQAQETCSGAVPAPPRRGAQVSVASFGGAGDGRTLNTAAFARAVASIERRAAPGGAELYVPPGVWLTGPFNLTSRMTLFLARGAIIRATQDTSSWPLIEPLPSYGRGRELPGGRYISLIHGSGLQDVVITGENGTIDGQGSAWWDMWKKGTLLYTRPHLLELMSSSDIIVSNVIFQDSPFWNIHPVYCREFQACKMEARAPHPRFSLLEADYDKDHRAHALSELHRPLRPLRVRTHHVHSWDERYAPYIERAGFIEIVRVYNSSLPTLDPALLTAFVDRWRPETHTFHTPCGEMTVTMQDVKMILCLSLKGHPVTGVADESNWVQLVEQFCGRRPSEAEVKGTKKTSGVSSSWIVQNFGAGPPLGAPDHEVEVYAKVWLWHFLGAFLFPDSSGDSISWIFLRILIQPLENIASFSWGTAVLAWTYRQLCIAYRRQANNANLGGCSYLLQVWIWERFPVGRPTQPPRLPEWQHQDVRPTALYIWRDAKVVRGELERRYKQYTDAIDVLTHNYVQWTPWSRYELEDYLSPRCEEEADDWLYEGPLIFFHIIEMHYPMRVYRQFGRLQGIPPLYSTNAELHGIDRRIRTTQKNWALTHDQYLNRWYNRNVRQINQIPPHHPGRWMDYLQWLQRSTRTHLMVPYTNLPADAADEDDIADAFDDAQRRQTQLLRAPLNRYVAQQLSNYSEEASRQLFRTRDDKTNPLRAFVKRMKKGCKKLAQKLSCADTSLDIPYNPTWSRSHTMSTTAASASDTRAASSSIRTPLDRGKGPASADDVDEALQYETTSGDDDDDDEEDVPQWGYTGHEEMGASQLYGAPFATQGFDYTQQENYTPAEQQGPSSTQQLDRGQRRQRERQQRDRTDVGWRSNVVPTNPRRRRRPRDPYTPGD